MLIAIDPGIRGCGVAMFVNHTEPKALICAGYVGNPNRKGNDLQEIRDLATAVNEFVDTASPSWLCDELVIEWPQVYRAGKSKGDPNDLLILTAVAGALSYISVDKAYRVLPRAWKGTVDPDACIERIKTRITPEEYACVELPKAASLQHNVWDAVGIGLHAVGRGVLNARKRVIAR